MSRSEISSLGSKSSFEKLSRLGKRARSKDLSLLYRVDDGLNSVNVAYSVGKKVGKAVTRNKVKRRLRSVFHEFANELPNGDYLLMVKPSIVDRRFQELRDELLAVLPLKGDNARVGGELNR